MVARQAPWVVPRFPLKPHYYSCYLSCDFGPHAQVTFFPNLVVGKSEGLITFPMKSDNFRLHGTGLTVGEVFKCEVTKVIWVKGMESI